MMHENEQSPPVAGRRGRTGGIVLLALLVVAAGFAAFARGRGYKTWLVREFDPMYGRGQHPTIWATRPADHDHNVMPDAFVACDVNLPNIGKVVDGKSLQAGVRLYRSADHKPVPAVVNTSGAGDSIVLKPRQPLDLNTQYTFEVTSAAKDTGGAMFAPYATTFTTAAHVKFVSLPIAFDKVALPLTDGSMYTCVEVGPDHRLYASTLDGRIVRYAIQSDGTLAGAQTIKTVQRANGGVRLITGIKFDPASTADHLVLWVNHGQLPPLHAADDAQGMIRGAAAWTGKLSRLSGPDLQHYTDYLIHLPRGWKDHLNNQMAFGPDGALYFCQAANTAMGAPDHKWGYRPERLLTAAVLRVDLKAIVHPPLDVQTEDGGHYNPFAPGAPLTLYATGIRNSYDILWHSNGWMYCGINGSAAGGNTPGTPSDFSKVHRVDTALHGPYTGPRVPALWNVHETEDDLLFKIEKGGYYGHPNPVRGEYVLDGGNPTKEADTAEITEYPAGTRPDRNWRGYAYSFGKNLSPCGVIEYQGSAFGGALNGKILFVRYSGGDDIIALAANSAGDITDAITGITGFTQFVNPVDLTEDRSDGDIYVAEFGGKRITLLRPMHGVLASSRRVCREEVQPPPAGDIARRGMPGARSNAAGSIIGAVPSAE